MPRSIDLYLEQEQQHATNQRERTYMELNNAIELTSQQDCRRMEEDEEAISMLLALGYLGMPGSFSICTYLPTMTDTAWACWWRTQNNRDLITKIGEDVSMFEDILNQFANQWNFNTISQSNVDPHSKP